MNCIKDNNGASRNADHIAQPTFAEIHTGQQHCSVHTVTAPSSVPQYKLLPLTTRCVITLRMEPIGCPETSVRNYHYSLRNNPKGGTDRLSRNVGKELPLLAA
jgi:hypothetical protein